MYCTQKHENYAAKSILCEKHKNIKCVWCTWVHRICSTKARQYTHYRYKFSTHIKKHENYAPKSIGLKAFVQEVSCSKNLCTIVYRFESLIFFFIIYILLVSMSHPQKKKKKIKKKEKVKLRRRKNQKRNDKI